MQSNTTLRQIILEKIARVLNNDPEFAERLFSAMRIEESEKQSFQSEIEKIKNAIKEENIIKAHEAYWEAKSIYNKMRKNYVGQKYIDEVYQKLFEIENQLVSRLEYISQSSLKAPSFNNESPFTVEEIFELHLSNYKPGFLINKVKLGKEFLTCNNISNLSENCLKRFLFYLLIDSLICGERIGLIKNILKITALEKEYEELTKSLTVQSFRQASSDYPNFTINEILKLSDEKSLDQILNPLKTVVSRCVEVWNKVYPQQKIRRYSEGNIRTDWEVFANFSHNKVLEI